MSRRSYLSLLVLLAACRDLELRLCKGRPSSPALTRLADLLRSNQIASFQLMRGDPQGRTEPLRFRKKPLPAELQERLADCALPFPVEADDRTSEVEFGIGFFDAEDRLLAAGSGRSAPGDNQIWIDLAVGEQVCAGSLPPAQDQPDTGSPQICWLQAADRTQAPLLSGAALALPTELARFEVYGWGFLPGAQVFLDGLPAAVERHGFHRLTVTPQEPPGIKGPVALRVQNRFPAQLASRPVAASLRARDFPAPADPTCLPADCTERCDRLRTYAENWQFLDGSDFTYPIRDETRGSRQPDALVAGDVNQDARDDLITANVFDNTLSLLLSRPEPPVFRESEAVTFKLADEPSALALLDLDGDHKSELIVASNKGGSLFALPNVGGPRVFAAPLRLQSLSSPVSLLVVDLDGNGRGDLLAAQGDGQVAVWLNPGLGALSPPTQPILLGPASVPVAMAWGDLNGDARPDVVVADGGPQPVHVLLNRDGGRLAEVQLDESQSEIRDPSGLAIADFNRDGENDLIVAAYGSRELWLFVNEGTEPGRTPLFSSRQPISAGQSPASLVAEDLNGDGFVDLAVALDAGSKVLVLKNHEGTSPLTAATFVHIRQTQRRHPLVSGYFFGRHESRCGPGALKSLATTNATPGTGTDPARGTVTVLPNGSH